MTLIYILFGMFFGLGVFLLMEDFLKLPYSPTRKAIGSFSKIRSRSKIGKITRFLDDCSIKISKLIKLDDFKIDQMNVELEQAGLELTPELFIAKCIVKALLVLLLIIPALLFFPIASPIAVVASVVIFFSSMNSLSGAISRKRAIIEYELPRFVSYISKTITHNRDVLSLLDGYLDNAGPDFKKEISITVADMKSGNYESAITRMETRVGSSMLSDVSRGLISVLRGDDTLTYWENLEIKFSDYQRQLLKQQALKVPGKVRRLSFCLLICFISFYVVIIGMAIVNGIVALF